MIYLVRLFGGTYLVQTPSQLRSPIPHFLRPFPSLVSRILASWPLADWPNVAKNELTVHRDQPGLFILSPILRSVQLPRREGMLVLTVVTHRGIDRAVYATES